jgi:hypothetical protein
MRAKVLMSARFMFFAKIATGEAGYWCTGQGESFERNFIVVRGEREMETYR